MTISISLYVQIQQAIEEELKAANLQVIDITMKKIIQLYETQSSRHSVMIIGETGSGKSVTWQTLKNALTRLAKENKDSSSYQIIRVGTHLFWAHPMYTSCAL